MTICTAYFKRSSVRIVAEAFGTSLFVVSASVQRMGARKDKANVEAFVTKRIGAGWPRTG